MRIQLVPDTGHPSGFLDLPWHVPLAEWEHERLVEVPRGIHRNVVRFVAYEQAFFALKELQPPLAEREYRLLRALTARVPAVAAAGLVTGRPGLPDVVVTRHLEFSRPYRLVLQGRPSPHRWNALLDALAELLVRLHLAGFFWGDCSLSNVLFRRDAGALCAYLVDAETGALHERLSDGQRGHDLEIAAENLVGELCDLAAEDGEEPSETWLGIGDEVRRRYEALWRELTDEELIEPGDALRLDARIRRLNELGFDVAEIELVHDAGHGFRLRLDPRVVEPGHHRRRLRRLTGLDAEENQARRLLNDVAGFRAGLDRAERPPVSEVAAAARWLNEQFEPAIAAVPPELRAKRAAAELFHELLEHRWFLSEHAGRDVGLDAAVNSYVERVLAGLPDERATTVARVG